MLCDAVKRLTDNRAVESILQKPGSALQSLMECERVMCCQEHIHQVCNVIRELDRNRRVTESARGCPVEPRQAQNVLGIKGQI